MSWIEITAVVFSLLAVWLSAKKHVLNWPAGIIGVSFYLLLFWQTKLYADMVLQVVFILQGIYGWYSWYSTEQRVHNIPVSYLGNSKRILYSVIIIASALIWGTLLKRYTDAASPYIDALASTISLVANWLLARRKIDNWILWIGVDVIYIGLFWYKELYLSSGIYLVFLLISVKGFIEWKRTLNDTGTVSC